MITVTGFSDITFQVEKTRTDSRTATPRTCISGQPLIMGRHGKNQTASAVYSYHEKKKDTAASGYGSKSVRLGKDSLQDFNCCCLSLQICQDPVVTPLGYLYDKQTILENLLHQKLENSKKLKEYERKKKEQEAELQELSKKQDHTAIKNFLSSEGVLGEPSSKKSVTTSISNMEGEAKKKLPSFWIPSLTPNAQKAPLKKPVIKTVCPMSGQSLRIKDLIPVNFTPVVDDSGQRRFKCAVTHDLLNNSVPLAVLKPSGNVVTMECVEKIIKPDMICPITGQKLKESDIIVMKRGGTGFAGAGVQLKAEKQGVSLMA